MVIHMLLCVLRAIAEDGRIDAAAWLPVTVGGEKPTARYRHTAILYQHFMVIFGGRAGINSWKNDLRLYNRGLSAKEVEELYGYERPKID